MLDQSFELKDEKVKELAKLTSISDFLPAIQALNVGTFLSKILTGRNELITISDIEDGLAKYVELILHQGMTTSPFGMAPFMIYQWLKVIEQKRFEKIITGLQLDLPQKDIINCLQLYKEAPIV
jgi:vacuolar-type H+-ATPase subunit C/Vma6